MAIAGGCAGLSSRGAGAFPEFAHHPSGDWSVSGNRRPSPAWPRRGDVAGV